MIKKLIEKIPLDKLRHGVLGRIVGLPLVLLFGNIGGLIAILGVAAKEVIIDKLMKKGNPEVLDWVASSLPVVEYLIIYNLAKYIGLINLIF